MDIVERLRDWSEHDEGKINDAREEAADEIERLREALKKMENLVDGYIDDGLTWADIGMKEGE